MSRQSGAAAFRVPARSAQRSTDQYTSQPPSTGRSAPVIRDASSDSRNAIAAATSSGWPGRLMIVRGAMNAIASGVSRLSPPANPVSIAPGATQSGEGKRVPRMAFLHPRVKTA